MSATVEKILREVKILSLEEREELWARVAAEEAKSLDDCEKQVERDSNAGELDHLLSQLKDDIKAGRVKPLGDGPKEIIRPRHRTPAQPFDSDAGEG